MTRSSSRSKKKTLKALELEKEEESKKRKIVETAVEIKTKAGPTKKSKPSKKKDTEQTASERELDKVGKKAHLGDNTKPLRERCVLAPKNRLSFCCAATSYNQLGCTFQSAQTRTNYSLLKRK